MGAIPSAPASRRRLWVGGTLPFPGAGVQVGVSGWRGGGGGRRFPGCQKEKTLQLRRAAWIRAGPQGVRLGGRLRSRPLTLCHVIPRGGTGRGGRGLRRGRQGPPQKRAAKFCQATRVLRRSRSLPAAARRLQPSAGMRLFCPATRR